MKIAMCKTYRIANQIHLTLNMVVVVKPTHIYITFLTSNLGAVIYFFNIYLRKTSGNFTTNYSFEETNSNVTKYYTMRSFEPIYIYIYIYIYTYIYTYIYIRARTHTHTHTHIKHTYMHTYKTSPLEVLS